MPNGSQLSSVRTLNIYSAVKDFRSGFNFTTSYTKGEAFPLEIGFEPILGRQQMPGHYKLGFIYDNNHHADEYFDTNGSAFVQSGLPARLFNAL